MQAGIDDPLSTQVAFCGPIHCTLTVATAAHYQRLQICFWLRFAIALFAPCRCAAATLALAPPRTLQLTVAVESWRERKADTGQSGRRNASLLPRITEVACRYLVGLAGFEPATKEL